jgi:hypothetical protein
VESLVHGEPTTQTKQPVTAVTDFMVTYSAGTGSVDLGQAYATHRHQGRAQIAAPTRVRSPNVPFATAGDVNATRIHTATLTQV